MLSWLAGLICCFPLLDVRPRLRGLARYERIRSAIRRDDFAVVSLWRARVTQFLHRLRPSVLADRAESTLAGQRDHVQLAQFQGVPVERAAAALRRQNVQVEQVDLAEPWAAPIKGLLPSVPPGGAVRLFVHDGQIVGFDTDVPVPRAGPAGGARKATKKAPPAGDDG